MTNKYNIVSVNTLIKGVQEIAVQLADKDFRKKTPASKKGRMQADMQMMRNSLHARLPKLDRTKPAFFPIQSYVIYHKVQPERDIWEFNGPDLYIPDKYGVVVEHDGDKVLVQFEGEEHWVRVDPGDLILRFIR